MLCLKSFLSSKQKGTAKVNKRLKMETCFDAFTAQCFPKNGGCKFNAIQMRDKLEKIAPILGTIQLTVKGSHKQAKKYSEIFSVVETV